LSFLSLKKMKKPCLSKQTGLLAWCRRAESNCRHKDFQSFALPTELSALNLNSKI
jgi:hypothetical protein